MAPVIKPVTSSGLVVLIGLSATLLPRRITMTRSQTANTSVKPVLMVVAMAGCAALLTPISTPGNMMIMSPGGYRFGDYWKLGLPMLVLFGIVAVLVVPIFWSF